MNGLYIKEKNRFAHLPLNFFLKDVYQGVTAISDFWIIIYKLQMSHHQTLSVFEDDNCVKFPTLGTSRTIKIHPQWIDFTIKFL